MLGLRCCTRACSSCSEQGLLSNSIVWASLVVVHRLSRPVSCGNLPGPAIKPVFPALAGKFLTTGPSGKSQLNLNYCLKA